MRLDTLMRDVDMEAEDNFILSLGVISVLLWSDDF